jgi:hypothetical protein
MKGTTIREALQTVVDYPKLVEDPDWLELPVHELVVRTLFDIANRPDASVRGSHAAANKAREMIFNRLVGRRRVGTHPAVINGTTLDFVDLTGELE